MISTFICCSKIQFCFDFSISWLFGWHNERQNLGLLSIAWEITGGCLEVKQQIYLSKSYTAPLYCGIVGYIATWNTSILYRFLFKFQLVQFQFSYLLMVWGKAAEDGPSAELYLYNYSFVCFQNSTFFFHYLIPTVFYNFIIFLCTNVADSDEASGFL